jgi:hypothetical protein
MAAVTIAGWRRLRIAIVMGGIVETALWLGVVIHTKAHSNPAGDGLEFIAVYFSTLAFLIGTLPGLLIGVIGRWLPLGAIVIGAVALLYFYVGITSL